jgi:hypothetical protein
MNKINWGCLEDAGQFLTGLVLGCLENFQESKLVLVCEPDLGTICEDRHEESMKKLPPLDEGEPLCRVAKDA